jgi:hypothetical protein
MKKRKSATTETEGCASDAQIKLLIDTLDRTLKDLLTRKEAAKVIGISPRTLANIDSKGRGIENRLRLGKKLVLYEKTPLLIWLEKRLKGLEV